MDNYANPSGAPVMTTLVIGADYTRSLKACLDSKSAYAERHGYLYIQNGEAFWDRMKPIAWSKIPFLLHVCSRLPEGALIWQSDADVLVTNPDIRIEDQIVPLLPADKDMILTLDACGHVNSGNIIFRNTAWARDFWKRVGQSTQFTYHPWWENAAMIALFQTVPDDRAHLVISRQHKKFNAYLRGIPDEPLWTPGDFLVHFAGVYDLHAMEDYAIRCQAGETVRIPMTDAEIQACTKSREQSIAQLQIE